MVSKKAEKSDLEKRTFLRFEIGLVLALAIAFMAIEWTNSKPCMDMPLYDDEFDSGDILGIDIIRTERKEKVKRPKPIEYVIVDNEAEIEEPELVFMQDIDPDDPIYIVDYEDEKPEKLGFVHFADHMPQYHNGGLNNFQKHIQQLVEYPPLAAELGIEGKVFVTFIVNKKGEIYNLHIIKGVDPLLDNEVLAAIGKSDKWIPGRQGEIPVNVAMSMPVVFRLQR